VAPPPLVPPVKLATAKAAASKPPRPGTAATPSRAAAPPSRAAAPAARLPDKEPSSSAETGAPDEGTPDTADEDSGVPPNAPSASATPRPLARADTGGGAPAVPPRHKPYNIQIEAAMDRNGAGQMARRLQALGYQPHLVPAQMNGQTWYKVVIGPYPTQEAAAVAQQQMRTKYNSIYGGARSGDDYSPPTD
jgi:septal ring-binding cell division protein DamX